MKTFAYIVNPITIKQLKDFWPLVKILPDFIARAAFKNLSPFKIAHIKRIKSISGQEISGFFILYPLLQAPLDVFEEGPIIEKIISASHIAEGLGAKILGLSGYTALISDEHNTLAKNLKLPLTSGNCYTSWSVFEAIYRLARAKNMNLKESSVLITGAANSIGSICAKKLSAYVNRLTLVDKQENKLENLREAILELSPIDTSISSLDFARDDPQATKRVEGSLSVNGERSRTIEVIIAESAQGVAKEADIIINADVTPLNIKELKPNAIACDISLLGNLLKQTQARQDSAIIEAGLIKLPLDAKLRINSRLPRGIVPASLAETMLLTFSQRFTNYSLLGENINLDKLEDIADLAAAYGFEVWLPQAPLR